MGRSALDIGTVFAPFELVPLPRERDAFVFFPEPVCPLGIRCASECFPTFDFEDDDSVSITWWRSARFVVDIEAAASDGSTFVPLPLATYTGLLEEKI